MRLDKIWERQKQQQIELGENPDGMTSFETSAAVKDLVLGAQGSLADLASKATHYKTHILRTQNINVANVLEEVVDVTKYVMSIAQLYGITSQQFFNQFMGKSDVVASQFDRERTRLEKTTKVVITDMDGCLSDLGQLDDMLRDVTGSREYRLKKREEIKDAFRAEGGFLELPPISGAPEAIREIKSMGYKLVVITARPHSTHKRLYGDTLKWLKRYEIEADMLLFERDKAEALCRYVYPAKPTFFVEDSMKHAIELSSAGVKVMLLGGDSVELDSELIQPVDGWDCIVKQLKMIERNDDGI